MKRIIIRKMNPSWGIPYEFFSTPFLCIIHYKSSELCWQGICILKRGVKKIDNTNSEVIYILLGKLWYFPSRANRNIYFSSIMQIWCEIFIIQMWLNCYFSAIGMIFNWLNYTRAQGFFVTSHFNRMFKVSYSFKLTKNQLNLQIEWHKKQK